MNQKVKIKGVEYDLGAFSNKEKELIFHIRERFRHGEVVIKVNDGVPHRILRTTEYENLN